MNRSDPRLKFLFDKNQLDPVEWKRFVGSHPAGTAFQMPEMVQAYEASPRMAPVVCAALDESGAIVGLMVGVLQHFAPRMLGSLGTRCVVMGGPLVDADNEEVLRAMLKQYSKHTRRHAAFTEMRNLWDLRRFQRTFADLGWTFEDHLDVLMDLTQGEDKLWRRLKHFRQKNIKRAAREGVQFKPIESATDADIAHRYIVQLYQRIKLPGPAPAFLNALFAIMRPAGRAMYLGAYLGERLIAARIVLTYGRTIYDYYAGADDSLTDIPAGAVMPWEVCRWGIANGYSTFDFGGAGKPNIPYGVRDYKLAFGGDLVNYGRFKLVHRPLSYLLISAAMKWARARKSKVRGQSKVVQQNG